MEYIPAKSIVLKNKNPQYWFGHDYNMNIYKGCSHGCIYCDSRSDCYKIEDFDRVRAKENAIEIIKNELSKKREKGVVGTGAMSDPYNPCEKTELLTRKALEWIDYYGFGVGITTKSDLITRDIDILKRINKHSPVCIGMTITTFDDKLSRIVEANVVPSSKRFEALKRFRDEGVYAGILLMPMLPFINDNEENMVSIIKEAQKVGAKFIYPSFGVTLRMNQRDYYFKKLDENFNGMKERYLKEFGGGYECISSKQSELLKGFKKTCNELGIKYKMVDIIEGYKYSQKNKQINFFDKLGQ